MELFEALHSQRAIRYFKPTPVPDDLIRRVLEAAIRAPNGGNRQSWAFVVLKDQAVRQHVGELYKRAWDASNLARLASHPDSSVARVYRSATYLARRMGEAPVLILACIQRGGSSASLDGASIYPAVQNLMLAARGPRPGHGDDNGTPDPRSGDQGATGHHGKRGYGRPDTDGLSGPTGAVRADEPPAGQGRRLPRPLG